MFGMVSVTVLGRECFCPILSVCLSSARNSPRRLNGKEQNQKRKICGHECSSGSSLSGYPQNSSKLFEGFCLRQLTSTVGFLGVAKGDFDVYLLASAEDRNRHGVSGAMSVDRR